MTTLPADAGCILLPIARQSIARALGGETANFPGPASAWLLHPAASFVSLYREGQPRGRTGTLRPSAPLHEDIANNALRAALHDPCFSPMTLLELNEIRIEIAVLSPPEPIPAANEEDVLSRLCSGTDGVTFRYGHHHGNFLPEMWEQYPEPKEFLAWLKYKSGLPPDFWDASIELHRYSVSLWRET